MEASTGELHGTMIASQATCDGCAYAYGSWNTLQAIQKKIDLHILMPCKPIACPPSMKQPIAKLTVITTFALHALSTGPRAYGTCILHAVRRPECSKNSCSCFCAHLVHQFALSKCIVVLTTKQQCDMLNTPCSAFCKQHKTCCPNDLHGLQAF